MIDNITRCNENRLSGNALLSSLPVVNGKIFCADGVGTLSETQQVTRVGRILKNPSIQTCQHALLQVA